MLIARKFRSTFSASSRKFTPKLRASATIGGAAIIARTSATIDRKITPQKIAGLNPVLISECIAYLRQPKSLREEGLFRIPGDLNQINFYLKQFDYSIKTNLDEELDPNTIASVLKHHIRDKEGFIPKKASADMFTAARQKDIQTMSDIVSTLPEENQKMMKEVFFLFKEVSLHAKENKMSVGAIATSCGLSVFPSLNVGNANLMLKSMIDNAEQIFPE